MALTPQQINELKDQLRSQVQDLPADKKSEALKQIDEMSAEAIETMLTQQQENMPPIYRKIVQGEIPSVKVADTPDFLGVLDNKPISQGHIVLIPKTAAQKPEEIPKSSFDLAESLKKKIIENLNAKDLQVLPENKFSEFILNLIPIYDKPLDLSSERAEKTPEELQKTKAKIETIKIEKPKPEIIETPKETKKPETLKLKRKIP